VYPTGGRTLYDHVIEHGSLALVRRLSGVCGCRSTDSRRLAARGRGGPRRQSQWSGMPADESWIDLLPVATSSPLNPLRD
jgi:hypothetical protein